MVDSDGNWLLTSYMDGLGSAHFPPDRVIFGETPPKPQPDGAIQIAEVQRENGERLPFTVRLNSRTQSKPEAVNEPANDMQVYLNETQELVRQQRYAEALERFLWFHDHALEHNPGMAGVRLSFALSYWKNLGDVYPPRNKRWWIFVIGRLSNFRTIGVTRRFSRMWRN